MPREIYAAFNTLGAQDLPGGLPEADWRAASVGCLTEEQLGPLGLDESRRAAFLGGNAAAVVGI